MKIALSGKGGSGKTTISATLARVFARQGLSVLAIDGDPNPNLGIALGLEAEQLATLQAEPRGIAVRQTGEDGKSHMVVTKTIAQITADHSALAPDGVRLLVGSQVDHPGSG